MKLIDCMPFQERGSGEVFSNNELVPYGACGGRKRREIPSLVAGRV